MVLRVAEGYTHKQERRIVQLVISRVPKTFLLFVFPHHVNKGETTQTRVYIILINYCLSTQFTSYFLLMSAFLDRLAVTGTNARTKGDMMTFRPQTTKHVQLGPNVMSAPCGLSDQISNERS